MKDDIILTKKGENDNKSSMGIILTKKSESVTKKSGFNPFSSYSPLKTKPAIFILKKT